MKSPRLEEWLLSASIGEALREMSGRTFVDLDPVFNMNIDDDYDYVNSGVTKNSFCNVYLKWIQYCGRKREKVIIICDAAQCFFNTDNIFTARGHTS
jgi:hypothetical protein